MGVIDDVSEKNSNYTEYKIGPKPKKGAIANDHTQQGVIANMTKDFIIAISGQKESVAESGGVIKKLKKTVLFQFPQRI